MEVAEQKRCPFYSERANNFIWHFCALSSGLEALNSVLQPLNSVLYLRINSLNPRINSELVQVGLFLIMLLESSLKSEIKKKKRVPTGTPYHIKFN